MIAPFAVLTFALAAQAPLPPEYWGSLVPGPHPIGFTQRWVIDSTRRLPAGAARGPRYRPVLMNLWYPAVRRTGARMPYRDYYSGPLAGLGSGSSLAEYAAALTTYVRDLAVRELIGAPRDSASPPLRQRLDAFLDAATAVYRGAPMRTGRLPVVFYLQGARASYDDNVALCEYLASQGYLVVGSAFPREDNTDFTTTVSDQSRPRDLVRLLLEVARMPNVEVGPVAAIGHSAGAQAMLEFVTDPTAPLDAVLSLDTTQDYVRLTDRTWAYFTDLVIERRKSIRTPIMFVAAPRALFELGDSLTATRRWFVTVPELGHNDFIAQGVMRRALASGLPNGDAVQAARARRSYDALTTYVSAWLAAFFASADTMRAPAAPWPVSVEAVPVGVSAPTSIGRGTASARALRHLFSSAGQASEFADAFLVARRAGAPAGTNDVIMMLLAGAIGGGERERAASVFRVLIARDSTVRRGVLDLITDRKALFERARAPEIARTWAVYHALLDTVGITGAPRPRP